MKKILFVFSTSMLLLVTTIGNTQPAKKGIVKADGRTSQIVTRVSQQVLSPFCPGKTLAMCTSPAAAGVRRDIQLWASQGKKVEEIKETLFEEYGEEYRMNEPPWWDDVGLFMGIGFAFFVFAAAVIFISRGKKGPENEEKESTEKSSEDNVDNDDYLDELRAQYRD